MTHELLVIKKAQDLYKEHQDGPCVGNCKVSPATFRSAAEQIVRLEKKAVELATEITYWHKESDGHLADARYFEGKLKDLSQDA